MATGENTHVLILLHGYGASKSDLEPLAQQLALQLPEWHFVLPDGPKRAGFGGHSWYRQTYAESYKALAQKVRLKRAEAREVVNDILSDLLADGISAERIYVGGFSQGATVALDVLVAKDGVSTGLGGLVFLSGSFYDVKQDQLETLMPIRAFVSHGIDDAIISVDGSRQLMQALKLAGHEVEFVEFSGGHQIPARVITELIEFLEY